MVARCSRGKLLGAWAGSEQRCGDPAVEEARAIRKGMSIAMKNGHSHEEWVEGHNFTIRL